MTRSMGKYVQNMSIWAYPHFSSKICFKELLYTYYVYLWVCWLFRVKFGAFRHICLFVRQLTAWDGIWSIWRQCFHKSCEMGCMKNMQNISISAFFLQGTCVHLFCLSVSWLTAWDEIWSVCVVSLAPCENEVYRHWLRFINELKAAIHWEITQIIPEMT